MILSFKISQVLSRATSDFGQKWPEIEEKFYKALILLVITSLEPFMGIVVVFAC